MLGVFYHFAFIAFYAHTVLGFSCLSDVNIASGCALFGLFLNYLSRQLC